MNGRINSTRHSYLTFRVGTQWYAMDVQSVFEVANMIAIASVPDMPAYILGAVNVRGQMMPVLDLRIRFLMPEREIELTTPIIFVSQDGSAYGIVVDDVDEVIYLPDEMISRTELKQRAEHLRGLTDHNGRLIMILDPVLLLQSSLKEQTLTDLAEQVEKQQGGIT